ncbi:DUF2569 domain-containing protein [Microvirga sp. c23x22]|uniref:DUF2569 domain-containing protein n=1 Tax=Microvirga terricola TaxID=2719797 RepID=A0ABX0V9S5_9HYPH|nr:DUF2569 domain-containing protein [Microvirga terricola]
MTSTATIPTTETRAGPKGIRGWMLLPAIGTFLGPPRVANSLFDTVRAARDVGGNTMVGAVLGFEIVVSTVFLGLALWLIYLLIKHRRAYPKLFIWTLAGQSAFLVVDCTIAFIVFDLPFEPDDYKAIFKSLLVCLVWIPYMLHSKRVRNTFIN